MEFGTQYTVTGADNIKNVDTVSGPKENVVECLVLMRSPPFATDYAPKLTRLGKKGSGTEGMRYEKPAVA
jgi:hypothetical protein